MRILRLCVLASTLVAVAAPATAQDAPPPGNGLVEGLKARGAAVRPLGNLAGLQGWLVEPADGNSPYSLYVTANGHAVAGLLYEPGGDLLTDRQIAALADRRDPEDVAPAAPPAEGRQVASAKPLPETPPPSPLLFREALEGALGFSLGATGPQVLVFADPACPYSRSAVARLGREAVRGAIRLFVIPVGLLGRPAVEAAAAIVGSTDMAGAWFRRGPPGPVEPVSVQRVDWNNSLFAAWPATAVPVLAWRTSSGRLGYAVGDITDTRAFLRLLDDQDEGGWPQ